MSSSAPAESAPSETHTSNGDTVLDPTPRDLGCCDRLRYRYRDILEHKWQLLLVILIIFLLGATLGIERSILPLYGDLVFKVSKTANLTFIITFGVSKGIACLIVGEMADRIGRKATLLIGWLFGLPVYVMILLATNWAVVTCANFFFGFAQGLVWPATIYIMLDLVRKKNDGIVLAVNQFAAYLAVGIMAFLAGVFVQRKGDFDKGVFWMGLGLTASGFLLSFFTTDTRPQAASKATNIHEDEQRLLLGRSRTQQEEHVSNAVLIQRHSFCQNLWLSFARVSFSNSHVFACCLAGFFNSFNEGIVWGLFPIYYYSFGLDIEYVSLLVAIHPTVWAFWILVAGYFYDHSGARWPITTGFLLETTAVLWIAWAPNNIVSAATQPAAFRIFLMGAIVLGIGTACSYPVLHVAVAHGVPPQYFASSIGIYKFWRELGYAFGALFGGLVADSVSVRWAMTLGASVCFVTAIFSVIFIKANKYDEAVDMRKWFRCGGRDKGVDDDDTSNGKPSDADYKVRFGPPSPRGSTSLRSDESLSFSDREDSRVSTAGAINSAANK